MTSRQAPSTGASRRRRPSSAGWPRRCRPRSGPGCRRRPVLPVASRHLPPRPASAPLLPDEPDWVPAQVNVAEVRAGQGVGELLPAPVDRDLLRRRRAVVGDQGLRAVRVAPGHVGHGGAGGGGDAGGAGPDVLREVAHRVVLDRVVDLPVPAVPVVHGDQPVAGAAAAVVRAAVLVHGQRPLGHRLRPVAGVVDDVEHVLALLVGDPRAARVLGLEGVQPRVLVVHRGLLGDVTAVAVPGDPAEVRVAADRRVVDRRGGVRVVGVPVPVVRQHLGGEPRGLELRQQLALGEVREARAVPAHRRIAGAAGRLVLRGDVVDRDALVLRRLEVLHEVVGVRAVVLGLQPAAVELPVVLHPGRRRPRGGDRRQRRVELPGLLGERQHVLEIVCDRELREAGSVCPAGRSSYV